MNLKKLSSEKQVKRLKSLLRSGEKTTTCHIAVSAFKHNLIKKEHGETVLKNHPGAYKRANSRETLQY